jgi:proton-dependent oligopeptide transporter, POT family
MSDKSFFGHPSGLSTLFMTEMWERLSYYGMRALLILYMTTELSKGGLGWDTKSSAAIYGLYTSSVYFLPLIGGWIADRFIGAKRATLIGGIIIAAGHFILAFPPVPFFYAGLIFVAFGTGFLKANIAKMVGDLYSADDERRDGGFSIFYMGINLGAFLAPFVCGTLAVYNWHWGFAAAGVGMLFGVIQYLIGYKKLQGIGEPPVRLASETSDKNETGYIIQMIILVAITVGAVLIIGKAWLMPILLVAALIAVLLTGMQDKISADDWKRLAAIFILFFFSTIFWMGFEQAGSSLTLFGEQMSDRPIPQILQPTVLWLQTNVNEIYLFFKSFFTTVTSLDHEIISLKEIPTSWLQAINPLFLIMFAPIFAFIWVKLGKRQPSDAIKFSLGLMFAGLGFVVVAYACSIAGFGKVSWWWLVLVYLFHTFGELCLSPVGLSSMTKLASFKMVSLMVGVWYLSISLGSYMGGLIAGEFEAKSDILFGLFGKVALTLIAGAFVLSLVAPIFDKLAQRREA